MGRLMLLLAQTNVPSEEIGSVASEFTSLLELVLVLIGILVLAYVVLRYVLPKLYGTEQLRSGPMTVVARYSLEPRKNLYIVQVGKEYFLVGTSETNVQFLTSLESATVETALAQSNL